MGWESFNVVRFDLGLLLQGQMRIAKFKSAFTRLLVLEVCNVKPTYRKSWPGNFLTSDLTFGPSFRVKRWFTSFGELSFQWIQICISSPMHRSSYPIALEGCRCIVFTHGVRMGGRSGKRLSRLYLRNRKV